MATLQPQEAYDVDLTIRHPRLQVMYQAFANRNTAKWDEKVAEILEDVFRAIPER
ncbi:hypothetical protein LTR17_010627 [Elasticomyces elasticus]|nr:hypothetical protein LTR17_010627 [Elasticomyces elasticus]